MTIHTVRRRLAPLAALLTALVVGACFDIEHRMEITADGSGQIRITLATDDVLPEGTHIDTILAGPDGRTEVHEHTENGRFFHEETLTFTTLNDVALQDDVMSLSVRDKILWGAGPAKATFTRTLRPVGAAGDSFGVVQRLLADRTYTYSLTLPGWIEDVAPVRIDGLEAVPEREGNTVTWRIPLGVMARVDSITFRVDFATFGELKSAGTSAVTEAPETVSPLLGAPG